MAEGKGKKVVSQGEDEPIEKKVSTKKSTPKKESESKLDTKVKSKSEKTYTIAAYCNIVGTSKGARYVAEKKFKDEGKLTVKQWEEMFLKRGIIW